MGCPGPPQVLPDPPSPRVLISVCVSPPRFILQKLPGKFKNLFRKFENLTVRGAWAPCGCWGSPSPPPPPPGVFGELVGRRCSCTVLGCPCPCPGHQRWLQPCAHGSDRGQGDPRQAGQGAGTHGELPPSPNLLPPPPQDPCRNHKTYREVLAKMKPPLIPFVPLILKGEGDTGAAHTPCGLGSCCCPMGPPPHPLARPQI